VRTIGDVSLEEEDGNSMLVGVSEPLLLLETGEGNESSPSAAWLVMAWFDGRVATSGLQAASTESAMAASASCIDSI
jgi:hypothetical protein